MCGICGILARSDTFAHDAATVTRMRDTMVHRGPDDAGVWIDPERRIALGHRRLSIVDLSSAGHQPMSNEDGSVWITYNGEIYNHLALRRELEARGHDFRSHTDSEVIVHLWEEEGIRCVEQLEGMFALAIWDAGRRELFLARDRLGVKPLYVADNPAGLLFASEIKAILEHPSIRADLDEVAFSDYLTFVCTPAPRTMFRGITKLGPGERRLIRADGTTVSDTYWTPFSADAESRVAGRSDAELEAELLDLLRDSIAKRTMADVPFGVFLSGGLDSSTNVALMAEVTDQPVRTFSVGFKEHERYNELHHARRVAELYGTDHHEVLIDWQDLSSFLPDLVHHQDEPIADWVCVPLHYVSKLARDNGTIVVQIGEGSDELFHGYRGYLDAVTRRRRYWEPFQHVPRPARRVASRSLTAAARLARRGHYHAIYLDDAAEGRLPFWGGAIAWQGDLKRRVGGPKLGRDEAYRIVDRMWAEAARQRPHSDLLQRMTYLELRNRLAELLLMRVDKMLMATSVEGREPFLDHHLVEFAMALPSHQKVRNGEGKSILKRAVRDLLPHDLIHREKQGFGAPVSEWFRGELGVRAQREIRSSALAERGLLDYDYIDRLWAEHRAGREWSVQLWNLYNVSAWYDHWIAGGRTG